MRITPNEHRKLSIRIKKPPGGTPMPAGRCIKMGSPVNPSLQEREGILSVNDPFVVVVVHVSEPTSLGNAMNKIRSWLDEERIEPARFTTATDATGHTFTIGFKSIEDANRFHHQFRDAGTPMLR
jgi:outer membrane lipoprotein-sorting protein